MSSKKHELSDSEWIILKAVWDSEPCTAPSIQEALEPQKGWAYTTVKTMMDRMVKKDLLIVEKIRNLHLYKSAITPAQARKKEILRTLKRAFDGAVTPMMQFLIENEQLSEEEYDQLGELLKQRKAQ